MSPAKALETRARAVSVLESASSPSVLPLYRIDTCSERIASSPQRALGVSTSSTAQLGQSIRPTTPVRPVTPSSTLGPTTPATDLRATSPATVVFGPPPPSPARSTHGSSKGSSKPSKLVSASVVLFCPGTTPLTLTHRATSVELQEPLEQSEHQSRRRAQAQLRQPRSIQFASSPS